MSYLEARSGSDFDRAYLSMMVVHHQSALDASNAVLAKNPDAQVKTWAQGIITAQQAEIAQMNSWLSTLGGVDVNAQTVMKADMTDMVGQINTSANPNRTYLSGMVMHHGMASQMASLALEVSTDPRVLDLSKNIVQTQAAEMREFKDWLSSHP